MHGPSYARLAATWLLALFVMTASAKAQGYTNGTRPISGLPFEIAPGVSTAGWYLNTRNNGVQDFGEMDVDIGGAGATFADPRTEDLRVIITSQATVVTSVMNNSVNPPSLILTATYDRIAGTFNDKPFEVWTPISFAGPSASPEFGRCAEWFAIDIAATRAGGTLYQPNPNPQALDVFNQFFLRGAAIGVIQDQRATHPFVETIQNSLYLATWARQFLNYQRVVLRGGSYGAVAATAALVAFPDFFDGAYGGGGYLSPQEHFAWNESYRLLEECQGRESLFARDRSSVNPLLTVLGWRGLGIGNMDLTTAAGLLQLQRPLVLGLGGVDGNQIINGQVEPTNALAAAVGRSDRFLAAEFRNGGHALADPAVFPFCTPAGTRCDPLERFLTLMENFTFPPATLPTQIASVPSTKYAAFLQSQPAMTTTPGVLSEEIRVGGPTGVGLTTDAVVLSGNTLIHGDRAGYVTSKVLTGFSTATPNGFTVNWRRFIGVSVLSVAEVPGQNIVLAGCERGLFALDRATGGILWSRLVATAPTTNYGDIRHISVGDCDAQNAGDEIVYQAMGFRLVVARLSDGVTLHEQELGLVTRLAVAGGSIYASMAHGQMARLSLTVATGGLQVLRAEALSPYLNGMPLDFVLTGGSPNRIVVVNGVPGEPAPPPNPGVGYPIHFLNATTLAVDAMVEGLGAASGVQMLSGVVVVTESAPGGLVTRLFSDSGVFLGASQPGEYPSSRLTFGGFGSVPFAVGFRSDQRTIDVYNQPFQPPTYGLTAMASTCALTHYERTPGNWEVTMLDPRGQFAYTAPCGIAPNPTCVTIGTGLRWNLETFAITSGGSGGYALTTPAATSCAVTSNPGVAVVDASRHDTSCTPAPAGLDDVPPARMFPLVIDRIDDCPNDPASFAHHAHAGGVIPQIQALGVNFTNLRFDHRLGRVASYLDDFDYHRASVVDPGPYGAAARSETGDSCVDSTTAPPFALFAPSGSAFTAVEPSPIAVDYFAAIAANMDFPNVAGTTASYALIASTTSGELHSFSADASILGMPATTPRMNLGWCLLGLEAIDVDAVPDGQHDILIAGSLLGDSNGNTLAILDSSFATVAATNAGTVVGVTNAGRLLPQSTSNPFNSIEFVVGCANGDVAIYSLNLANGQLLQIHRENAGSLAFGMRRSMAVMTQANGDVLLGAGIDGGYVVYRINRNLLPNPWLP